MKGKRSFDIAFVGLKPGEHSFEYKIDDHFFEEYQPQDFINCQANVKLTLDKHSSFIMLQFEVGGQAEAICDRCGNNRPFQLWDEFKIVVKMVENPGEMNETEEDPDVQYIGRTESHINTADWIFEFINLSLPTQRMCNMEEIGGPFCNKEVLQKLADMKPQAESSNIWKGLDKFKSTGDEQN